MPPLSFLVPISLGSLLRDRYLSADRERHKQGLHREGVRDTPMSKKKWQNEEVGLRELDVGQKWVPKVGSG